jgi:predicted ester cyclase
MSQDIEAIKSAARRTLEEIFPTVDEAGLAEVVHPDCVNHDAPPGAPQGLEGMTQSMRMLAAAFSDRRWEIHQAIAEGDIVVLHCTFSGRHTGPFMGLAPTNRPFASRQVHLIRFQNGKGIEHRAVRDDLSFLRQVGALPSQPPDPSPPQPASWAHRRRTVNTSRAT